MKELKLVTIIYFISIQRPLKSEAFYSFNFLVLQSPK